MLREFIWPAIVGVSALVVFSVGLALYDRIRARLDFDFRMQRLAWEVARRGRSEYRYDFDYSPDSIDKVEEILDRLHRIHSTKPLSDDELSIISLRWGAYVGEALKRVRPGKWQRDSEKVGVGTLPLVYQAGHKACPRSWVYKRIVDGEGDNIVSKFYVASNLDELEKRGTSNPSSQTD